MQGLKLQISESETYLFLIYVGSSGKVYYFCDFIKYNVLLSYKYDLDVEKLIF